MLEFKEDGCNVRIYRKAFEIGSFFKIGKDRAWHLSIMPNYTSEHIKADEVFQLANKMKELIEIPCSVN